MPKIIYSTDESDDEDSKDVATDVKTKEKKTLVAVKKKRLKDESSSDDGAAAGSSNTAAAAAVDVQQPATGAMVINFSDFDGETLRKALELLEQGRLAAARQAKISSDVPPRNPVATDVVTATTTTTVTTSKETSVSCKKVEKKPERSHSSTNLIHKNKEKKEKYNKEAKKKKITKSSKESKPISSKNEVTDKHKSEHKTKKDVVLDAVTVESGSVNKASPRHTENKKKKIPSCSSKSSTNNVNCSKFNVEMKVGDVQVANVETEKDFASDDDWNVDISGICDSILSAEVEKSENVASYSSSVPSKVADVKSGEVEVDKSIESLSSDRKERDYGKVITLRQLSKAKLEVIDRNKDEVSKTAIIESIIADPSTFVPVASSSPSIEETEEVSEEFPMDVDVSDRPEPKLVDDRSKEMIELIKIKDSKEVSVVSVKIGKDVGPSTSKKKQKCTETSAHKKHNRHKHHHSSSSSASTKLVDSNKRVSSTFPPSDPPPSSPSNSKLAMKDDSVVSVNRCTDYRVPRSWRSKDVKLKMTPCVVVRTLHPSVLRRLAKYRSVKIRSNQSSAPNEVMRNNVQLGERKEERKSIDLKRNNKTEKEMMMIRDRRIEKAKSRGDERSLKPKVQHEEEINEREERTEIDRTKNDVINDDEKIEDDRSREEEERPENERTREERTEKSKDREKSTEDESVKYEITENDRLLDDRADENDRLREEKTSKERTEKEKRVEKEKAPEQKSEKEKSQEQRAEKERLREQRAEKERLREQRAEKERLREQRAEKERLREQRAEKERLREQRAEKERLREQRAEKNRLREQRAEKDRLQNNRSENERLPGNSTENERLRDDRLDKDIEEVNKPDNDRTQEERRRDQEELKKKRPWRSTIPGDKRESPENEEQIKKRRIIRPFKSSVTKLPSPKRVKTVPAHKELVTIDEKGPHDMYSSFDTCNSMKEDITGDNFLMDDIETDALESTASALATDDVLLQARQVGQPTTDFSQLLSCSVVSSDVTKAVDFEDCLSGEEMLSTWNTCTDASSSLSVGDVISQSRSKQETEIILAEEGSMKEYENYLDDCDFRGEMPSEKIDKSSDPCPDDLYKGTPKNQLEELKVQINGVSAGFVNHSPVKLSPHNVMLSSSVCDVISNVITTSKEVDVIDVEIDCVQSTSKIGKLLLLPTVDNEQANSNASVDSKNNLVAAPFAMTTDLEVTTAPVVDDEMKRNSSSLADVDANSENSYNSQCSNASMQKETVFATYRDMTSQENNMNPKSEMDSVWSFKKKEDDVVATHSNETSSVSKTPSKQVSNTPKPPKPIQAKERKPIVSTLSIRIAKELGTEVQDVDTLSIMAPSSDEDSLIIDESERGSPIKMEDDDDNKVASCSISDNRLSGNNAVRLRTAPVVPKSNDQELILSLQKMKNADLIERFGRDVVAGNHKTAIKIFGVLQSKVIEPRKYTMIRDLLLAIVNTERKLDVSLVNELFQTVVRLVPSYNDNVRSQIQLLRCMFSIFKKSQHVPSPVHNYLRANENERSDSPGIVQTYNRVLREAIYLQNAEVLHLYRDATEVGIEIEETSLRSLLIIFHRDRLTHFALDLYNLGCCMGIYPRLRIREWPHCLRLKTFYSEHELEIMIRDFFHKLAINLRTNPRFYEPRAINREEKFTIYLYLEELPYQKVDKGGVLEMIDCSLSAALSRVANVFVCKIDRTLAPYIMQREDDRIIGIKAAGTIQLMSLLLEASQTKKSSHSSVTFNHTVSESSIENNPFKTET